MISTLELKTQVLKGVASIDNNIVLEEILDIINLEINHDEVIELNNEQKTLIQVSLAQIESGQGLTQHQVKENIEKWLMK